MQTKIKLVLAGVFLSSLSPAVAWIRGNSVGSAVFNTGSAVLNIGGNEKVPSTFINVFKVTNFSFSTPSDVSKVDTDGYLTSTPAGNVGIAFPTANMMWTNTRYRLRWTCNRFNLNFNNTISNCSASGATVSSCGGSATIDTTANAGTVDFDMAANQFSMYFGTTGTFSRCTGGEISLYRLSDDTDYLAGEIFTPEFKAVLTSLNPRAIRPMGWVNGGASNFNGETTWSYRNSLTTFNWGTRYPPSVYGGTVSGTNTYTGSAAPDTPGSWTDGEQYIGVVTNANTSTTVTINIGSRGAKTVVQNDLSLPSIGQITAGSLATFTYDAVLDKVLWNSGGIAASVPIEAQVQLANRTRSNLWTTIPVWANDNYVTQFTTVVRDNLNPVLIFYPEYSNEVWNPSFPPFQWAYQRATALGLTHVPDYDWYGLRVRQIMGNLIPAVFSGQMSRLRRVNAYQAAGDSTTVTYRFNGGDLNPASNSALCTFLGGTFSGSCSGAPNYSASPNRPIDVVETIAYAPYAQGTNLCLGPDATCTPTSANASFYQALVTAWEGGSQSTAIQMIDDDIRTGRTLVQNVTASGTTFTTPAAHGFVANTTDIAFQVTGGTTYSGIVTSTLYRVTGTSTAGCPGAVVCNFTIQPYVGGFPSGANINAGSAGSGTTTVGASNAYNFVKLASTWYQFGETNAALYDAARPAGMTNLRVEQYEGNLEPKGLSSAQCTSLGITGSDCTGSIAAAILAWKNDTRARATQKAYFDQFMGYDSAMPPTFGLMSHSKTPSQLVLQQGDSTCTGSDYALLSGCLPNSTPFQTYYGFQDFRAN